MPIKPDAYMPELHKQLAEEGAELLFDVIRGYPKTFESPIQQNDEQASYGIYSQKKYFEIAPNIFINFSTQNYTGNNRNRLDDDDRSRCL